MNKPSLVPRRILELLAFNEVVSSSDVAKELNISRQAAHYHLSRLCIDGVLVAEGSQRSSRYRLKVNRLATYPLDGQAEHDVWNTEKNALRELEPELFEGKLHAVLNFIFTEMVNNAIDHSFGTAVTVRWILSPTTVTVEIEDDGIGAFASLRQSRALENNFQAIGELSKGKQTTAPDRHSGLGIFLTSRLSRIFTVTANEYSWKVDNDVDDFAVGALPRYKQGTVIRCEIARNDVRTLNDLMTQVSDPVTKRLNRTNLKVELFKEGLFVSRTEAKLIGARLEGFERVELDFAGLSEIGQGFADELFRVWQRENPGIELVVVNANQAVGAMIMAVTAP